MTGNILGLIGIILTIIFGIYSIWAYKKSKKKISIELKNEQCYSLFRDDVTRLNIELIYNKKTLTNPLILFKAKIINNGSVDIDKNRIFKPLKIISSKEFNWLEAKTIVQSNGSLSIINILKPNELQIEWDLLKSGEYIEFEALIEIIDRQKLSYDKTNDFYNGLKFDYRITDLNNILKENKVPKRTIFEFLIKNVKIVASFALLLGTLLFITEYYPEIRILPVQNDIILNINNGNKNIKASIESKLNDDIQVRLSVSKGKNNISIKEFNKQYKIINIDKVRVSFYDSLINKIFGALLIICGSMLLILNFKRTQLMKRISIQDKSSH